MTKNKCFNCKKKTGMLHFDCKCQNTFCLKCKLPEEHNCNYDYISQGKEFLNEKLINVSHRKLEKI